MAAAVEKYYSSTTYSVVFPITVSREQTMIIQRLLEQNKPLSVVDEVSGELEPDFGGASYVKTTFGNIFRSNV